MSPTPGPGAFVAVSDIAVDVEGTAPLEQAFADRLRLVEAWPGFQRLQVWREGERDGRYVMVSWWDSREDFLAYLRSDEHKASHARIPEQGRPRPSGFRRYTVIAT